MRIQVIDHPILRQKMSLMRDIKTRPPLFRQLVREISALLAYEAAKEIAFSEIELETPMGETTGLAISKPYPLVVPILRAGLGMLEGVLDVVPVAEVGFLGIARNEETLMPVTYANRLPDSLAGRHVILIDPMLATGGTLNDSIDYVKSRGAQKVTCICMLGAPEGIEKVQQNITKNWDPKDFSLYLGALDEKLNEVGYIVPGLGDAGDRMYGLAK